MGNDRVTLKDLIVQTLERDFANLFVGVFTSDANERVADSLVAAITPKLREVLLDLGAETIKWCAYHNAQVMAKSECWDAERLYPCRLVSVLVLRADVLEETE